MISQIEIFREREEERARRMGRAFVASSSAGPRAASVVGGGWAALGAAHNLTKAGFRVTVIDAAPETGGLAVEVGIKGFWSHYKNIESLLDDEIGLPVRDAYNAFSETAFYSARGLEVVAPVFRDRPRLPAPLGPLVYTLDRFTGLPLGDRLTAFPLTQSLLEFDLDEETYRAYDLVSFATLCKTAKVSKKLYDTFLAPVLLALLFVPPEELSAAAALSVLKNYVLSHQPDFDVAWPKLPPSAVFKRWQARLEGLGCSFQSSTRVERVTVSGGVITGVDAVAASGEPRRVDSDVVVLATGAAALPKIVQASGLDLSCEGLARVGELTCAPVSAVRIDTGGGPRIDLGHSANVFASGPVAGTFFDVGALMGDAAAGRVLEVDWYNATEDLLESTDDELARQALGVLAMASSSSASSALEEGRWSVRAAARVRKAALRWIPGSHLATPQIRPEGAPRGLYVAGDLVRNGPGDFPSHLGARGLSQEKSLVTGLVAGTEAAKEFGAGGKGLLVPRAVEPEEPHVLAAKDAMRLARSAGLSQLLV